MIRSAIAALAAAAMLTACVGGSDPKPDGKPTEATATAGSIETEIGDCYADAESKVDPSDPDFTSEVKCTRHTCTR